MQIEVYTRLALVRSVPSFFDTKKGKEWLENASKYLEELGRCLNLQTITPSSWFILIDSSIDDHYKSLLTNAIREFKFAMIIEGKGWEFAQKFASSQRTAQQGTIQIRIDYDDLVSHKYIEIAKMKLENHPNSLVVFETGYVVAEKLDKARLVNRRLPPFLAVGACAYDVFSFDHYEWNKSTLSILAVDYPCWIQRITGSNISNSLLRSKSCKRYRHANNLGRLNYLLPQFKSGNKASTILPNIYHSIIEHRLITIAKTVATRISEVFYLISRKE